MSSPSARLLELLSLLQTRPHWNAPELAARLRITERTVRRDITRLRQLGYPVEADAGRAGGYQLGRGGALPPLLLTEDESVAVAVGLRAAASGGVAGYDEAAVAALAKLEQMLPATLRERVLALNSATMLTRPGTGPLVDPEALLTVAQACRRRERLRFGYRDGSGTLTERRVEPHGLVSAERRWYLVGRDLDRQDWRTFRLDRMSEPVLTGHRFVATEEPDVGAMVARGLARAPYRWQAVVVLDTDLRSAEAEVARTIGALEEVDGEVVLRIGANEVEWLARYIAGLPFNAEVRSPPEVRAAMRALGRQLQASNRARPRRPPRPAEARRTPPPPATRSLASGAAAGGANIVSDMGRNERRIAVAACERLPELDDDWPPLRAALADRGIVGTPAVWSDPAVDWASFDLVVIRGTWDYVGRLSEFLSWARRVTAVTRLVNPIEVVEWNTDKRYLQDLAVGGVPVVETSWVPPGQAWSPPDGEFVVKPTVSAGGFETARYRPDEVDAARTHVARLHGAGQVVMVQPYLTSVDRDGETALVYLGGRFSHAINKAALLRAGAGVDERLWARQRIAPSEASADQHRVAEAALAAAAELSGPASYARVDLLAGPDGGSVVIEVELVEPSLFLHHGDGAAARLAEVLVAGL